MSEKDAARLKIQAVKRLIAAEESRDNLLRFIQFDMYDTEDPDNCDKSRYQVTPQAKLLTDAITKIDKKELKRLAVSISPQTGKTQVLSRHGIAWLFARNPRMHIILATYNETMAENLGADVRDIINSNAFKQVFPDFELAKGGESKRLLQSSLGGRVNFVGVGGSTTGMRADAFIIDDPIKNDEEAQSPTFRDGLWKWFNSVVTTRCRKDTPIVIVHCLTGDTRVTMGDGSRKEIKDIRPGDEILSWQDGEWAKKKVLNWTPQGEDAIYEVRTGNSCVRGNAKHPLLVMKNGAPVWVPIGEISEGDRLVCSGVEPEGGPAKLTKDQAWLLGFMFGDGWLTQRNALNYDKKRDKHYPRRALVTCCALSAYPNLNAKIEKHFRAVFGVSLKTTKYGYLRTEIQKVGKWFAEHGLAGRAKTKRLPDWVFSEPKDIREAILSGFAEADGHRDAKKQTTVAAANKELILQLRDLARGCGIPPSNMYTYEFRTKPPNSPLEVDGCTFSFKYGEGRETGSFYTRPVRSVEEVGKEEVYDIQVEGTENFIADGVVVHNTRWHEDDLIGRLCDPEHPERKKQYAGIADKWSYLNIPNVIFDEKLARALGLKLEVPTNPDVIKAFGAKPMASLWEDQFPLELLAEFKMYDEQTFNALRMGKPTPDDGAYFKADMLLEYGPEDLPKNLRKYGASDHAVSEKQAADSTVLGCVGIDENDDIWILPDVVWDKMETDRTVEELLIQFKTHNPQMWWMESELISKSFGPFLRKRMIEEGIYTTIDPVVVTKDKRTRARAIQGRMSMRKVHFPQHAPWWSDAKAQILKFPYGAKDDFVDFLAHIGLGLMKEFKMSNFENKSGNVVHTGSIQWILAQTRAKMRKEQKEKASQGW